MRCLDASFVIDLVKGEVSAVRKAKTLDDAGERLAIPAPALAEVLVGAYFRGGLVLRKTLELLSGLDVLLVDAGAAEEAGRIGAELLRRGTALPTVDLLIAAVAKSNRRVLVTRDDAFARIPDLAVEAY